MEGSGWRPNCPGVYPGTPGVDADVFVPRIVFNEEDVARERQITGAPLYLLSERFVLNDRASTYRNLQSRSVARRRAWSHGSLGGGDAQPRSMGPDQCRVLPPSLLPEPGLHSQSVLVHDRVVSTRARS